MYFKTASFLSTKSHLLAANLHIIANEITRCRRIYGVFVGITFFNNF